MPSLSVKDSGSWKAVIQPYVLDGGTWKPALSMYVKDSGSWKLVWTGFTATASPSSWSGATSSGNLLVSATFTATTSGGVGPFAYQWTLVSGGTVLSADNATSASTTFSGTGFSEIDIATYKCVVTDTATGLSDDTNTITVEGNWI